MEVIVLTYGRCVYDSPYLRVVRGRRGDTTSVHPRSTFPHPATARPPTSTELKWGSTSQLREWPCGASISLGDTRTYFGPVRTEPRRSPLEPSHRHIDNIGGYFEDLPVREVRLKPSCNKGL